MRGRDTRLDVEIRQPRLSWTAPGFRNDRAQGVGEAKGRSLGIGGRAGIGRVGSTDLLRRRQAPTEEMLITVPIGMHWAGVSWR